MKSHGQLAYEAFAERTKDPTPWDELGQLEREAWGDAAAAVLADDEESDGDD